MSFMIPLFSRFQVPIKYLSLPTSSKITLPITISTLANFKYQLNAISLLLMFPSKLDHNYSLLRPFQLPFHNIPSLYSSSFVVPSHFFHYILQDGLALSITIRFQIPSKCFHLIFHGHYSMMATITRFLSPVFPFSWFCIFCGSNSVVITISKKLYPSLFPLLLIPVKRLSSLFAVLIPSS